MKKFGNYSKAQSLAWLMASLLAVLVTGCGGNGSSSANGSNSAPGSIRVSLTDAPACGFDEVNVTVTKVRAHQSSTASDHDGGWTDITLNPARKINLLNLTNGVFDGLGEAPLAAGHYTQLRLVLDPNTSNNLVNSVVPTGGVETALKTPSAVQSGIKLIHEFDVVSGQRVDLMLDFNACKSIVKRGNGTYALKPVIKVLPFVLNGIEGFVDTSLLGSNVTVTAQQNGVIIQSTAPNSPTGYFFLSRLLPGSYDVVIAADGHATATIANVSVATATSVVNVSDNVTRVSLPASATRTVSGTAVLNPTSTTEVAYVTAKQALGSIMTTVKFVAADDSTTPPGAYTLTLPIEAPLLGQYATPLPITFVAQSGVAGHYTMEASATGYQTQSASVNISTTAATQNFTLVP
jgi:hypothetical protein